MLDVAWAPAFAGIAGALLTTVVSWTLRRRRESSDIHHTDAETISLTQESYLQLMHEHQEMLAHYRELQLRMARIEIWATSNGYVLPNGKH